MSNKNKKRFFASHAKSSALLISLAIHVILLIVAISFVAVTVYQKEVEKFEGKELVRPRQQLKKLKVKMDTKKRQKPKLRKRLVSTRVDRKMPEIKMPEMAGMRGGVSSMGDDTGLSSLGFTMPEINFFGAKAKGSKICFVVHFGPATIGNNPYTRMTGYILRQRLEDMVDKLPEFALFNVACFWMNDTDAISEKMIQATKSNKKMVKDWMEPVNPLEGDYNHCFSWGKSGNRKINAAKNKWPTRVDVLPFYSPKWVYPYNVSTVDTRKYLPEGKKFTHWTRTLAWSMLTQKPDTIFILTTNYIDPWGAGSGSGKPNKMKEIFEKMARDVYGPDKKKWPTVNIVVLATVGSDSSKSKVRARKVLKEHFGPVKSSFRGQGSTIGDITDYMNEEERALFDRYEAEYSTE